MIWLNEFEVWKKPFLKLILALGIAVGCLYLQKLFVTRFGSIIVYCKGLFSYNKKLH